MDPCGALESHNEGLSPSTDTQRLLQKARNALAGRGRVEVASGMPGKTNVDGLETEMSGMG